MLKRFISKATALVNKDADKKEILKGSTVAFALKILGIGATYVLTYVVSRGFGATGMGVYSVSISIIRILGVVVSLGIPTATLKFMGEFVATKTLEKSKPLYWMAMRLTILLGLACGAIFFFFSEPLAQWLLKDAAYSPALLFVAVAIPFYGIHLFQLEMVRGFGRIGLAEYLRGVHFPIVASLILLGMLWLWPGTYIYMWAAVISIGVGFLIGLGIC